MAGLTRTAGEALVARSTPRAGRLDGFVWRTAVAAPLAFTAADNLTRQSGFGRAGRAVTVALLLCVAGRLARRLERDPPGSLFRVTVFLFLVWLVHPAVELLSGSPEKALFEAREVLYLAIWCSPLWVLAVTIPTTRELHALVRWLDAVGLVLAGSVFTAYLGHGTSWQLGETLESGDGVRAFGPLGDMVSYALLLFVCLELMRRRWIRFALFTSAALLGQTRGVLAALAVGLIASLFVPGAEGRAVGRGRRRVAAVRLRPALVAAAVLGAGLLATPMGQQTLERFSDWVSLVHEQQLGGRLRSMRFAAEHFAAHPVLGLGPGGYADRVAAENLRWSYDVETGGIARGPEAIYAGSAENQVFHTAAETGLVGIGALALWAWIALRTLLRAIRIPERALQRFFQGAFLYAVVVFIGTQSAVYLLDRSAIALLLCVVLGAAERGARATEVAAVLRRTGGT